MKRFFTWLLLAMLAPSCGGGGIGGTGIGTVSGFGSVFVNGIEWFTEGAEVIVGGESATEADLRLGMLIRVDGKYRKDGTTGVARSVVFESAVQGPVDAVTATSATTNEVEILGRTVVLEQGYTVFDDSDPGFGFGSVAVGDVLAVSGHVAGDGAILATWVRRLGTLVLGETEVEFEGVISGYAGGTSFEIGPVAVEIDAYTDLTGLPGGLANGLAVEVEGVIFAPGAVLAVAVELEDGPVGDTKKLTLEGLVSDVADLGDFLVAGQPVDASSATFSPPDPSFIAEGALVEVEGPVVGGVLVAQEVQLEAP